MPANHTPTDARGELGKIMRSLGSDCIQISGTEYEGHFGERCEAAINQAMQLIDTYTETLVAERVKEAERDVRGEVAAQKNILMKLIMGAGEYHDDPYEYVVRLSDIKSELQALGKFDLNEPVYREIQSTTTPSNKGDKEQ